MSARNPLAKIWAIMVRSQRSPAVTWSPWQPPTVKNADRQAPRVGPDQLGEFAKLEKDEGRPEQERDRHRGLEPEGPPRLGREARHAAGEARQEQEARLDRDVPEVEDLG